MILPSSKAETRLACAHNCLEDGHKLFVRTQEASVNPGDEARGQWTLDTQKAAI